MSAKGRRNVGIVSLAAGVLAVAAFTSTRTQALPDSGECPAGQMKAALGVTVEIDPKDETPGYATKDEAVADALSTLDASPYGGKFGTFSENEDGSFAVEESNDLISDVEVQIDELSGERYVPGGMTFCAIPISTDERST